MGKKINELTSATPAAADLLELSRLSPTVTITGTNISAQASDNSFNHAGSGFIAAGFLGPVTPGGEPRMSVKVTGFTGNVANNIFTGRITALTTGKMTIGGTDGDVIVDDAAGESVTITAWESVRGTAGGAAAARNTVTALATSGSVAIDCALGDYFTLALAGNVTTFTFSNLPGSGKGASIMVQITQDSTPRTVGWPASFKWAGGVAGVVSTGSGAVDVLALTTFDNGTTWRATLAKAFA
jgi:hypothetical protein